MPIKIMQQIIEKRWVNDIEGLLNLQIDEIKSNLIRKLDSFLNNVFTKSIVIPEYLYLKLKERGYSSIKLEGLSRWIIDNLRNRIMPQLTVPMHFGNMYSASVWAQVLYIMENYAREFGTIYFGSYGSGATCISGLLKMQAPFNRILQNGPKMNDFIENKIEITVEEYEKWKTGKLDSPNVALGMIDTHERNQNRGFLLHYCDEGCIIPHIEGLNYCPKGHAGFHSRFFPLYAVLKSDPILTSPFNTNYVKRTDCVRISPTASKGSILEYELRRSNATEQDEWSGLLNWVPTYIPVKTIY